MARITNEIGKVCRAIYIHAYLFETMQEEKLAKLEYGAVRTKHVQKEVQMKTADGVVIMGEALCGTRVNDQKITCGRQPTALFDCRFRASDDDAHHKRLEAGLH